MRRALLLLAALTAATTACGGSKSAETSTTATTAGTPVERYVAAGNEACIRSDKRIFKIGRLTADPKGWAATAASARTALSDMRKVAPPKERAAAFKRMIQFGSAMSLAIQQVHDALVKKNLDNASAAQFAAAQLQDKVHEAAKAAGLTFCQQTLTNWPA